MRKTAMRSFGLWRRSERICTKNCRPSVWRQFFALIKVYRVLLSATLANALALAATVAAISSSL